MAYIITNKIMERTGFTEDTVQKVLDTLRDVITEDCAIGESVSVRGLFTAKPIRYRQLTKTGLVDGFTAKLVPSKTLTDAIERESLDTANLTKSKETAATMEQAMRDAGISVMELPGLG